METEFSESNIFNKNTDTINIKNCLYCNIPFTEKLWCGECINSLEILIENGNNEAMFNLAICYENGEGTEKSLGKAFYWYQKAMFNLAVCYENGEGTEKSLLEKVFYYWHQKAEKKHVKAMFYLAKHYGNGKGTEKNLGKAFYCSRKWC
ncbi:unnamed protein product [Rhizophagus irregularis]|nr:unnamed protein product [Rhizophagus irregularis]